MAELRRTTCNRDCPDSCAILATIEGERVVKLSGDPDHPITRGSLCYRTHRFLERHYSSERLTTPLLRKRGTLTPVSWDEALDFVAERLERIRSESGPAAIFHYRSGGSLGALKTITDFFFANYGPVTVKRGDICAGAGIAAQELDFGVSTSSDLSTLLQSRHILLWGKNVHTSSPHTLRVLLDARKRGAGLVLIDPVRHAGTKVVDEHFQVAPGGDFSLAMAAARLLFERGGIAPEARSYCDNLDAFEALVHSKSVGEWCRRADVKPRAAEEVAARLADGPCAIVVGWGLGRRTNGGAIVRALDALGAVSGNLGIAGGGVSFYYRRRRGFEHALPQAPLPPRTISEVLFASQLLAQTDPPLRALWVTAGNPVAMLPDSAGSARAIAGLELSVVVDAFLTDTANAAQVVLPTTTLLEEDDLVGAYGHHFLAESQPVVQRPSNVKTDLEIIQALAARVGLSSLVAGSAREWKERMLAAELAKSGVTLQTLSRGAVRNPLHPTVAFEGRLFPTTTGKVQLLTEQPSASPAAIPEYPLVLMALSTRFSQSSQWCDPPRAPMPATVHPRSAAGMPDGALATLESRHGKMCVRICLDGSQREGIVLIPKGGHFLAKSSGNSLLAPRLTDLGEGGALYEEPVRLGSAAGAAVAH